jgi:hypothetical protein
LPELAAALAAAGYRFAATHGTAALRAQGHAVREVGPAVRLGWSSRLGASFAGAAPKEGM